MWRGIAANRQAEEHSTIGWFILEEAQGLNLADPIYPVLFERYMH